VADADAEFHLGILNVIGGGTWFDFHGAGDVASRRSLHHPIQDLLLASCQTDFSVRTNGKSLALGTLMEGEGDSLIEETTPWVSNQMALRSAVPNRKD
jgi:hypothetical protein